MTRARKAEQSELNKLMKDIGRRMEDFEEAVQRLKEFKECAEELDEQVAQQAAVNKARLDQLNKDFEENKIKAIRNAAEGMRKVIISKEELDELRGDLERLKEKGEEEVRVRVQANEAECTERLRQGLELRELKYEAETAQLKAGVELRDKQIENLKDNLARMSDELKSQKDLTASVVTPRYNGRGNEAGVNN